MTKRYAIADYLEKPAAEAVVRHDKWQRTNRTTLPTLNDQNFPHPRTKLALPMPPGQEDYIECCPLGLYLIFLEDLKRQQEAEGDKVIEWMESDMAIPEGGTTFASFLIDATYDDWEGEMKADEPAQQEKFEQMAMAANEFIDDWDAGRIPYGELGMALGLVAFEVGE